jgi:transposase-like protein
MPKSPAEAVSLPDRTRRRWTRTEARGVMAAYEASGLSIEEFAEREGLKPERVARWMRKLKSGKPSAAPKFVELHPVRSSAKQVEIVLRTGHILFVNESFDPRSLRWVLELLERDAEC